MQNFSLLIKPASADCNLRCSYCFYLPKAGNYPESPRPRMTDKVLERLVSSYMQTPQPRHQFGWQGGEPTLMGADFFMRAVQLQKKYAAPGANVANGLQTNLTLMDDKLAKILSDYKFLAGVSLDGPADIHDEFRKYPGGKGSHGKVLEGIETLRKHKVEFNALVLVNSKNVSRPAEVYDYLKKQNILFHQYIPCVEFDEKGALRPYSITGAQWGDFLCGIFEKWLKGDTGKISVRLFDSILNLMVLNRRTSCDMGGNCRQYFLIEHNGDVYPCDFFVEPERKLGNIMDDGWEDLLNSPLYAEFGKEKSRMNEKCSSCRYLTFCMGDCLKHRFRMNSDPGQLSWLCAGREKFYARAIGEFIKIAQELKKDRPAETSHAGRNEQCPCGSGLKYKKCCGR